MPDENLRALKRAARDGDALAGLKLSAERVRRGETGWRPMTDLEARAARALGRARFFPGSSAKRIARSLEAQAESRDPEITEKQAAVLWRFCWSYRKSIGDPEVLAIAEDLKKRELAASQPRKGNPVKPGRRAPARGRGPVRHRPAPRRASRRSS